MNAAAALLRISRPRFWTYLAGPWLIGYTLGARSLSEMKAADFWVGLAYFILPANILLYGVNDLADTDTDQYNPKKGTFEYRSEAPRRPLIIWSTAVCLIAGAILAVSQGRCGLFTGCFLILALIYSLPPLRLKARPALDSISNVLYVMPGLAAYCVSGGAPRWEPVVAAGCWTAAMHLFSAIPDIESDRRVGLRTTAVVLGRRGSLLVCAALWGGSAAYALALARSWPPLFAAVVYPLIPLSLIAAEAGAVNRVYWAFPYLNGILGLTAFFVLASQR